MIPLIYNPRNVIGISMSGSVDSSLSLVVSVKWRILDGAGLCAVTKYVDREAADGFPIRSAIDWMGMQLIKAGGISY